MTETKSTTAKSLSTTASTAIADRQSQRAVLNAYVDQDGGHWIRYGTETSSALFSIADVETGEAFNRLRRIATFFLTPASKTSFKSEIERVSEFTPAIVARSPGWHGETYVHADGTCHGDTLPLIGFDTDASFSSRGSLSEWKAEIGPLVKQQTIPICMFAYALIGAILRFAGNDSGNPIVEIVMNPNMGKTSLLKSIMSFWGDDPNSDIGLGVSLNTTLVALDELRNIRADGLLCLDETNHAARSGSQSDFLSALVFQTESSASRRRMGEANATHTRLAAFITTNNSIASLIRRGGMDADAAKSRILSINVGDDLFDRIPEGHESAKAATEALVEINRRHAGTLAHAFTRKLTAAAELSGGLQEFISQRVAKAERFLASRGRVCPPRVLKTYALMVVVANLCRDFGIFEPTWHPRKAVYDLYNRTTLAVSTTEANKRRIIEHVRKVGEISVAKLKEPLTALSARAYVHRDAGSTWIIFDADHFKAAFSDWQQIIRDFQSKGFLKTEKGQKPKTTIHGPRALCHSARVFCISAAALHG